MVARTCNFSTCKAEADHHEFKASLHYSMILSRNKEGKEGRKKGKGGREGSKEGRNTNRNVIFPPKSDLSLNKLFLLGKAVHTVITRMAK